MNINANRSEIQQLFTPYFGQDYDLFFDYDRSKPFMNQAVTAYKKDCEHVPEDIQKCTAEIKEILSHNYSEQQLENEIFPLYGIAGDPDYKLSHRKFLEKVVEELER